MCGIVGIVGDQAAAPLILRALKKLEYRGYDSAGIAMSVNSHLEVRKGAGKLSEVDRVCRFADLPGTVGIGHVRWATHGGVTVANAHPHLDCTGCIAVVHNGIIENFQELKEELSPRHTFTSETDTEIISHLIAEEYLSSCSSIEGEKPNINTVPSSFVEEKPNINTVPSSFVEEKPNNNIVPSSSPLVGEESKGEGVPPSPETGNSKLETRNSLERAVYNATRKLKGSYAILVISSLEPGKIVAARQDSPLVVGLGEKNSFFASDMLCLIEYTDKAVYIEDGETVVLTHNPATRNLVPKSSLDQGSKLETGHTPSLSGRLEESAARREDLSSKLEVNSLTIYDSNFHEIHRDPVKIDLKSEDVTCQGHPHYMLKEILEQPQALRQAVNQNKEEILDMVIGLLRSRNTILTACGTSRHAALVGRYVFSKLASKFSEVVMASEFQYFRESIDKNTLVIAVSQSGETADVLQGVHKAQASGARIFSLVNTQGSTLARLSDRTLYLHCGPEIAVAATKSFVSQLALFYLLAFAMDNRLNEGMEKIKDISCLIEEDLNNNGKGLAALAQKLKDKRDFYYIGRGINFAIAGEGALKLKEIAYVHAEGMPAGELKHGTLALIEPGTPVIGICPGDYTFDETMSNLLETKARGAYVIGVSDKPHPAFDEWIHIPKVEEIFYPLVSVIPLQLFAYHSAVVRGYDPDKPRNLAKSVTVK